MLGLGVSYVVVDVDLCLFVRSSHFTSMWDRPRAMHSIPTIRCEGACRAMLDTDLYDHRGSTETGKELHW